MHSRHTFYNSIVHYGNTGDQTSTYCTSADRVPATSSHRKLKNNYVGFCLPKLKNNYVGFCLPKLKNNYFGFCLPKLLAVFIGCIPLPFL